jgi:transposase
LQEAVSTITERLKRLKRLDNELTHQVKNWRYYPVVKAVQAMRGVRLLVATGVIAELGDLTRFDHPRKLMSYLGLVPSEHSSGGKRRNVVVTAIAREMIAYIWAISREVVLPVVDVKLRLARMPA